MDEATKGFEVAIGMNLLQLLKDIDDMGIEDLQELRRLHRAKIYDQLGNDLRELMGGQCTFGCHVGGVSHRKSILPLTHQIPVEPLLQI